MITGQGDGSGARDMSGLELSMFFFSCFLFFSFLISIACGRHTIISASNNDHSRARDASRHVSSPFNFNFFLFFFLQTMSTVAPIILATSYDNKWVRDASDASRAGVTDTFIYIFCFITNYCVIRYTIK